MEIQKNVKMSRKSFRFIPDNFDLSGSGESGRRRWPPPGRYLLAKAISPQGRSADVRFLFQVEPDEVAASLGRCSAGRGGGLGSPLPACRGAVGVPSCPLPGSCPRNGLWGNKSLNISSLKRHQRGCRHLRGGKRRVEHQHAK